MPVLYLALTAALALPVSWIVLPLIVNYRVEGDNLQVRLFKLVLGSVKSAEVDSMRIDKWWRGLVPFSYVNYANRPLWWRGCVMIRRRSRFLPVLLTPADPVAFIGTLQSSWVSNRRPP